ncbi:MAG: SAM hydroxide adenosyltransferase [Ginsengibacter sp.]
MWPNISADLSITYNQSLEICCTLSSSIKEKKFTTATRPYSEPFDEVAKGKTLAYLNSLLQLSFALNQGSFANLYHISSGSDWSVEVEKVKK